MAQASVKVGNLFKGLRGMGAKLGIINDNPLLGAIRYKAVYLPSDGLKPQGLRERRRRVRQIVMGIIPFSQLGGRDALAEYHLAKRNYVPTGLGLLGSAGRFDYKQRLLKKRAV